MNIAEALFRQEIGRISNREFRVQQTTKRVASLKLR